LSTPRIPNGSRPLGGRSGGTYNSEMTADRDRSRYRLRRSTGFGAVAIEAESASIRRLRNMAVSKQKFNYFGVQNPAAVHFIELKLMKSGWPATFMLQTYRWIAEETIMSGDKPFDRLTLEHALAELGRRAFAAGRTVEIVVYGGSALLPYCSP
jgi:hypothetical protein